MNIQNIVNSLTTYKHNVNVSLSRHEPVKLLLITIISSVSLCWFYDFVHREESLKTRAIKTFFRWIKKIPQIRRKIKEEMTKSVEMLESKINHVGDLGRLSYMTKLPSIGMTQDEIMKEIEEYGKLCTVKWKEGFTSGTVYVADEDLNKLMSDVYSKFLWSNPLHPETFPDIRKMEAEVVRMCCTMFNGDEKSCGSATCGGTESIMLAMKTYRDIAIEKGVRIPEMIVPNTAHAAFDKAAQYFRIKIHHVRVDPVSLKVDVRAMKRLINGSTCVLVASAPQYPHGIVDPVEEIAKLGERYNIPVHVDCCLGGFLVPFMEAAECSLDERFDFRLPGVTSISCDNHKYGFAPKGSSVIMYRSHEYWKYQIFVQTDWPGGVYGSPTFAGSRPGVIIATCWAAMMLFGFKGYVKSTREIVKTTIKIRNAIKNIPGLSVLGEPKVCVVGIHSDQINIYNLLDAMTKRGWQLSPLQYPHGIHIAVTQIHTKPGVADRFINDIKEETAILMKLPVLVNEGSAAIYGMSQSLPDRTLVSDIASGFITALYNTNNA